MRQPPKPILSMLLCLCFAACFLPALIATASHTDKPARITINVLSDLYYLPQGAGDTGTAARGELRLIAESASAADEALNIVLRNRPEALVITGDLTNDGARQSAQELAEKLKKVEQAGIPVYVINGDSDVKPGGLTPSEFRAIFRDFGYDGADDAAYYQPAGTNDKAAKQGGLSYAVTPKPGVRLLMIDNAVYTNDCPSASGGAISDGLMEWILRQAKTARKNGETLVAAMHRPLLPHKSKAVSEAFTGVIDSAGKAAQRFADAGLRYIFTGHMHETDVAKYTSPKGNWLLDMETGSLVTCGAPVRTAVVEGDQITLSSESVKEIAWQGRRIDYQNHLRQRLYSDAAFTHYAMRFLDGWLNTLETDGLKKGIEKIAKTGDLDTVIEKAVQAALNKPVSLDLGGKFNLQLRLDEADTVTVESSASFLLPPFQLSIKNNLMPIMHDLFAQIDAQWLKKDASGQSPLRAETERLLAKLCTSALSQAPDGSPYTVNMFLTDMMLAHSVGQEAPDDRAAALLEQLNPALTRALLTEQVLPAAAAIGQKMLNDLKLDASHLSGSAGALWKPAFGLISSMRAGTLAKLAGFSAEDALQKAMTDEWVGRIGALVSGLASGFLVDTQGIDDQVDGAGVRYTNGKGVLLTATNPQEAIEPESDQTSSKPAAAPRPQKLGQTELQTPVATGEAKGEAHAAPAPPSARSAPAAPHAAAPAAGAPFATVTLPAVLFMAAAAFAVSDFRRL